MRNYLKDLPWWQTINPETGEPRWKTFKYELACTEICGRSHYGMQKEVVVVKDQAEYEEWVKKQTPIYVAPATSAAPVDSAKGAGPASAKSDIETKENKDSKDKTDDKGKRIVSELTAGGSSKKSK